MYKNFYCNFTILLINVFVILGYLGIPPNSFHYPSILYMHTDNPPGNLGTSYIAYTHTLPHYFHTFTNMVHCMF